jgi:basic amino acid/polyamine antiporter, APA family
MSNNQQFLKVLGKKDVLALAFGAMIGWGWVVSSGTWITEAGSIGAVLAFAIGGVLVLLIGLTYAELSSALPLAGGEFVFSYQAMGRLPSFITTWAVIFGYVSVIAFEAVALPTVFEYIIPSFSQGYLYTIAGWDVTITWASVGIIGSIIVAWINYRGIKLTTVVTFLFIVLLLISGLLLLTGSTISGNFANMEPLFEQGIGGLLTVIIMTPFFFVGFDVIPQAAEEINLPKKRIGQLLIISVIMAVVWYISIIIGVSMVMTPEDVANSNLVTADAMAKSFGGSQVMANILVLGGIGGIVTSWLGFYVGGSRAIYALARAGMLPKSLGELHPKYKTPYKAIKLIAVLSTAAPLLGRPALVWFVNAGGLGLVIAWTMVALSFIILRKKAPEMNRPYKLPGGTVIGWFAIIMALGITTLYLPGMPSALTLVEWIISGFWLLLGIILYNLSMKKYGKENADRLIKKEIKRVLE